MSEKKWATVVSSFTALIELHEKQMEVIKNLVEVLMDEDNQNATKAHKAVLECIHCTVRDWRSIKEKTAQETKP